MNVARFENETDHKVDREKWGLPVPNVEAAYISLGKYAKDVPALDATQVTAMNLAFRWTERHFGPYMQNSRVKSEEEVRKGVDMTTSPGFPWTRKYAKKRAMVDDWKDYSRYMEEDWERLRDPLYVAVFGNSLKEEIRPQHKIDENSIRTFTAGPFEMTIHGNRLFEDMNEKFYRSHLKTASVVGFTPLKGGWDVLYRKLRKHPNGFALDESQYDSSLRAYMMWGCAQFRWNMLRAEDQTVEMKERLLTYYQNLIHTVILTSDGVFVRKIGGNPSGSVNTISDNTLILYMLLAYGWIMTVPIGLANYDKFDSEVSLALCGDDNTWSVSDAALPYFNARTLIDEWKRIGVTTTTDCLDPRPIEDLDFLSAFTVFVDGIACPLYSREKILTSLLYSRNAEDPAYTLVRACALLRVGWTDPQLRGYLKELISWMVIEYGTVLRGTEEWRQALCNIPTEDELYKLFLGQSRPMVKQSCSCVYPAIKSCPSDNFMPRNGRKKMGKRPPVPSRKTASYKKALVKLAEFRPKPQRSRRRRQPRSGFGVSGNKPGLTRNRGIQMPDGLKRSRKMTFSEDEQILDIAGSSSSAITQVPCNPGIGGAFPFLSQIATRFEKYVFTKLEYYYKREVSEFATAGQTGKVVLSFDYDASDLPPTSKTAMMDSDPHVDGMPCENMMLRVDCKTAFENGPKYVLNGRQPGGTDIKTYNIGTLNIGVFGSADGINVGELHCRYAGYFEKPVIDSPALPTSVNLTVWSDNATDVPYLDGTPFTEPFTVQTIDGIGTTVTGGGYITLPKGVYLVTFQVVSTIAAVHAASTAVITAGISGDGIAFVAYGCFTNPGLLLDYLNQPVSTTVSGFVQSDGTAQIRGIVSVTVKSDGAATTAVYGGDMIITAL